MDDFSSKYCHLPNRLQNIVFKNYITRFVFMGHFSKQEECFRNHEEFYSNTQCVVLKNVYSPIHEVPKGAICHQLHFLNCEIILTV